MGCQKRLRLCAPIFVTYFWRSRWCGNEPGTRSGPVVGIIAGTKGFANFGVEGDAGLKAGWIPCVDETNGASGEDDGTTTSKELNSNSLKGSVVVGLVVGLVVLKDENNSYYYESYL